MMPVLERTGLACKPALHEALLWYSYRARQSPKESLLDSCQCIHHLPTAGLQVGTQLTFQPT